MCRRFYPDNVPVPQEWRTERLSLRPLRAADVELDYAAVMSSTAMLRCWSQGEWPADDFTLAENLDDLRSHEREHLERRAFTFTVLDPSATQCLGCVYVVPLRPDQIPLCPGAARGADIGFWVRESEIARDLDQHLLATLLDWFDAEWAFECVLFTIGRQNLRQAALMAAAGLQKRMDCVLPDGRLCWVFG